jgi:apolipoprotein N-acyltransferase
LRLTPGRRGLLLGLLAAGSSAALLWLAAPPADLAPLAFVALGPLLWALRGQRARRGALFGLVFGLVYFGLVLTWLLPATNLGWFVLVPAQAAWMALTGAYTSVVWRWNSPLRTGLAVSFGWIAVEWLRGTWPFGGFTWGGLGYTQHDNPFLLPLASVLGVWGLGLVIVFTNVLLLYAVDRTVGEWRPTRAITVALIAVVLCFAPGLIPLREPAGPPIDVAIVQGNVSKFLALGPRVIEDRVVAENHARLHRTLAGNPPDLAVWPENALDRDPTLDPDLGPLVAEAINLVGAPTVAGAITTGEDGLFRNENLLYGPDGEILNRYVKNHIVPFGEYVPFRKYLSFIDALGQVPRDLAPGTEPGRFTVGGTSFSTAICFENTFPDLIREFTHVDAGFILISTNNSTFLRTSLSEQHVAMSQLRAVENGRWIVHAAISGISAVIDERGRIRDSTDLFVTTLLRDDIPQATGRTPWNVVGGWLPAAFVLGAMLGFLTRPRRVGRAPDPLPPAPKVTVILPTYNEADTIGELLARLIAADERLHVLVVDDSSPDGTAGIVEEIAAREKRVRLIRRPGKQGLATAYFDGFKAALDDGADLVVEMDSDLSHRPEELPRLLEAADGLHLVIGSRYVPGGEILNWTLGRRIVSQGGNLYARLLLGFGLTDATSGFRVFRREVLERLLPAGVASEGYAFQIELALRSWLAGYLVGEVPITFDDRRQGASKFSRRIVFEALWRVLLWSLRVRFLPRRLPVGPGNRRPRARKG